jgi:hypothetical protein
MPYNQVVEKRKGSELLESPSVNPAADKKPLDDS